MSFISWLKQKPEAMTQAEYGKAFVMNLLIQILVLSPCIVFYLRAGRMARSDLQIYALTVIFILMILLNFVFGRRIDIRNRLLDLYPNSEMPNKALMRVIPVIPVVAVPVYIFLLVKKKPDVEGEMPWFFNKSKDSFALCCFLLLSAPGISALLFYRYHRPNNDPKLERAAFWTTTPMPYYLRSVVAEVRMITLEREYIKDSISAGAIQVTVRPETKQRIQSVAGRVLLEVSAAGEVIQAANRAPASALSAQLSGQNIEMDLIEKAVLALEVGDKRGNVFLRFNPIHFLFPIAMIEASFATLMDHGFEAFFDKKLFEVLEERIARTSKLYPEKAEDLVKLQQRLYSTRSYLTLKDTHKTWFAKLGI